MADEKGADLQGLEVSLEKHIETESESEADSDEIEQINADNQTDSIEGTETEIYETNEAAKREQLHLGQYSNELVETDVFHVVVQKNKFKALFDIIPEAAIIHDGKKIINVNKTFEKVSGYKKEEIVGKTLSRILKGNKLIKRDGNISEMMLEQGDAEEHYILLLSDIGALKEMEKCYALFNILSDHIQDAVIQVDAKRWVIYSNNAACKLFGLSETEMNKISLNDIFKKRSKLNALVKGALSGEAINAETECVNKNGSFLASITLHNINNGKELLCVIRDISKEKELKLQVERAKEENEQLVNNVNDVIFSIDTKGNIIYINFQFEKQLGHKTGDVASLVSIIHPDDLQRVLFSLSESKKGFKELEFRLQNSKKKWIYFSANAGPIKEGSKVIGFRGTMRNIDDKKKAEDETERKRRELIKQNKELQEKERMKSEFVSNVSHDLRTPLTSIQGYSELLANKTLGEMTKEQVEAAGVIHSEALRLSKLINDLLDVSRLDAGKMVLHKKPFFLSSLEDKCSCQPLANKKGLTIIWNTPDEISKVYGDPDRISQVLINLVSNSIKHTEVGVITVNAFSNERKFVQVDVIDTGTGIPKSERENIFTRFYQIHEKRGKKEGTGLGLSIAKEIIELHGGKIWVNESGNVRGAKISFTLPKYYGIQQESDVNEEEANNLETDLKDDEGQSQDKGKIASENDKPEGLGN